MDEQKVTTPSTPKTTGGRVKKIGITLILMVVLALLFGIPNQSVNARPGSREEKCSTFHLLYTDGLIDEGTWCGGNDVRRSDMPDLYALKLHVSCSDKFIGGVGQKSDLDGHVVDKWWIIKTKDGKFEKSCGELPSPTPEPVLSCVDLSGPEEIVLGNTASFNCEASFSAESPVAYFRYKVGAGAYVEEPTAKLIDSTTNKAVFYLEADQLGTWVIQCQVCIDQTREYCTQWGQTN